MAALAEILADRGALISGSDTPETFYTDRILRRLGIPYAESFDPANVPEDTRLVIHSAAYDPDENPELSAAVQRGIPVLNYPQALGLLSESADSSGIAGTHGKTTTAALSGTILKAWRLPVTVLVGSEVAGFGDRSTLILGRKYLIAETCEYRRHFLYFHPRRVVMTSVEADHLDYFTGIDDVMEAFTAYADNLIPHGQLIVNRDDPGACEVAERIRKRRRDVRIIPYGTKAGGRFRIVRIETTEGSTRFRVAGWEKDLYLHVPGRHSAYNAAAALALGASILEEEGYAVDDARLESLSHALEDFRGSRRRSEILGTAQGVLFIDDYGHHPTEIATTLAGLKSFYPGRRIIADFMSHTYSRTKALLAEFGTCFADADLVILHRIYASAREQNDGSVDGRTLFREVQRRHRQVVYFEEPEEAIPFLRDTLRSGDLLVTMGAGDNWRIGRDIYQKTLEAEK